MQIFQSDTSSLETRSESPTLVSGYNMTPDPFLPVIALPPNTLSGNLVVCGSTRAWNAYPVGGHVSQINDTPNHLISLSRGLYECRKHYLSSQSDYRRLTSRQAEI